MLLLSPRVEHLGLFSFTANDYLVNEGHAVASSAFTTPEAVPASDAAGVVRYRVPNGITAALA
jgi:hypothetical protein